MLHPPIFFGMVHQAQNNSKRFFFINKDCILEDDALVEAWYVHVGVEAGSDPRGHLGVTWGVFLCAGKPPLADIILSHPPDLTRCDSVIGLAIPAMSGHIQYQGAASGDLYI